MCTRGLLRPRIEVSTKVLETLDDEALTSALLHEAAHARAVDPLRYFLAAVCLSLNPLAGLLRTELSRWRFAREAACDEEAIHRGAPPLALARAIVTVARSGSARVPSGVAALAGGGTDALRIRVGLILEYAEGRPARRRWDAPFTVLAVALVAVALLPHTLGTAPLDRLHLGIELALHALGLS